MSVLVPVFCVDQVFQEAINRLLRRSRFAEVTLTRMPGKHRTRRRAGHAASFALRIIGGGIYGAMHADLHLERTPSFPLV